MHQVWENKEGMVMKKGKGSDLKQKTKELLFLSELIAWQDHAQALLKQQQELGIPTYWFAGDAIIAAENWVRVTSESIQCEPSHEVSPT